MVAECPLAPPSTQAQREAAAAVLALEMPLPGGHMYGYNMSSPVQHPAQVPPPPAGYRNVDERPWYVKEKRVQVGGEGQGEARSGLQTGALCIQTTFLGA